MRRILTRGLAPLLLIVSMACAGVSPRAQLVQTHQAIQVSLAAVDDAERIVCFGSVVLPPDPTVCSTDAAARAGLTPSVHRDIHRVLAQAYRAQIGLGEVIATWAPGTPVDFSVVLAAAEELEAQVRVLDLRVPPVASLLATIARWRQDVAQLRAQWGGR